MKDEKKPEDKKEGKKEVDAVVLKVSESLQGQLIVQIAEQTFDDNVTDNYIGSRGEMNRSIRLYKRGLAKELRDFYNKENENNGGKLSPLDIEIRVFEDLEKHPINDRHGETVKSREDIGKLYSDTSRSKCTPKDIQEEIFKSELVPIERLTNDVIAMLPENDLPVAPKPSFDDLLDYGMTEELQKKSKGDKRIG